MGARGGDSPTGLKQRELRTLFLRAPYQDWAALTQGYKTEFRTLPQGVPMKWLYAPTPVVLYAISPQMKKRYQQLMVLTERRTERLSDLAQDEQALMREGFATYKDFRQYWRRRTHRPYRPLDKVEVFRLAPWTPMRREELGRVLLERLYGDFLRGVA